MSLDLPVSFQGRTLEPRWAEVPRALLLPSRLDDATLSVSGGAYDATGALVPESLRPARLGHWVASAAVAVSRAAMAAPSRPAAIFGGHLFPGWGHFLLETLSTAWARDLPDVPVLFAPFAHDPLAPGLVGVLDRVAPLLAAAGWGGRPLELLTEPVEIERLYVPERLAVYGTPHRAMAIHPAMAEVYARLRACWAAGPEQRLFARRPADHIRAHPLERSVEAAFGSMLGTIVVDGAATAPEAQVAAFAGATAVLGYSGSNLHNAVFSRPGTPVVEVTDLRSAGQHDPRNPTQAALCDLLGQPYVTVEGFERTADGALVPRPAAAIAADARDALARLGVDAPMAPRRILVHAGFHKTATTAIQVALHAARPALRAAGVAFPGEDLREQIELRTAFLDAPARHPSSVLHGRSDEVALRRAGRERLDRLAAEMAEPGTQAAILSSEDLSLLDDAGMARLRDWVVPLAAEVSVLFWVREPVAQVTSLVQQRLKPGSTLAALLEAPPLPHYAERIGRAIAAFGRDRVTVRTFEEACRHPDGVVGAFLDDAGIRDEGARRAALGAARTENPSLSREGALLLDAINRARPLIVDGRRNPGRAIGEELRALAQVGGPRFSMPPEAAARVHAATRADARWLAEEFGIDDYLGPQADPEGPGQAAWPEGWTVETLARGVLDLVHGGGDPAAARAAAEALGIRWAASPRRATADMAIPRTRMGQETTPMGETETTRNSAAPSEAEVRLRRIVARALWGSEQETMPPADQRVAAFSTVQPEMSRRAARLLRHLEAAGVTLALRPDAS